MANNNQLNKLVNGGIVTPNGSDWRISIKFIDGNSRTIRISPGRLSEEQAIDKAKLHARIFDETVVDKIEARRVERSVQIVSNATIQKTTPAATAKSEKKKEAKNDSTGGDD